MHAAVPVTVGYSPIKGSRHLSLSQIELDREGVIGDRRFCFVDLAARRVLRTVQHPALLTLDATLHDGLLRVTLPNGASFAGPPGASGHEMTCDYWGRPVHLTVLSSSHADAISSIASALLERPVALAAAPARSVIYGAGLSVITQASLDDLSARIGAPVDARRFRASLMIDTDDPPYAEDTWAGRVLRVGEAIVRVGAPIGRCGVIELDPLTGARSKRLLTELASYRPRNGANEPCFGVYAEVVVPGIVPAEFPQA